MTEEQLTKFINNGGIDKIGHAAFTLLAVIVEKAKQSGYPKVLEVSVSELMYKAKFRGYQQFKTARDTLTREGIIKRYINANRGEMGTFFLNYD